MLIAAKKAWVEAAGRPAGAGPDKTIVAVLRAASRQLRVGCRDVDAGVGMEVGMNGLERKLSGRSRK